MSSNKVSVKQVMTLEQVADYLEDLAISLRKGTVVVQKDGEVVRFDPPETVQAEVEAKQKKGKAKFELELTWHQPEAGTGGEDMHIGYKEPEASAPIAAEGAQPPKAVAAQKPEDAAPVPAKTEADKPEPKAAKPKAKKASAKSKGGKAAAKKGKADR